MHDWISKCGCNCGRCPAFRGNAKTAADRERCSEGWHRYLGFRLNPERIICDGCQVPDDRNPTRIARACRRRTCALTNGVENCAYCSAYACEDLEALAASARRADIEARLGERIPEEDYLAFVEPYDVLGHLDAIRASLRPDEIVPMATFSVRPAATAFPEQLPVPFEQMAAYRGLHGLLSEVGCVDDVSYAAQARLQRVRRDLLKMLWAFGLSGERDDEGGARLVIDGKTYLEQKIHSGRDRAEEYFEALANFSVRCELVPEPDARWLTPTGALRKQGWSMTLSFDDEAGGEAALKGLQRYAVALDEAYGKQAFRRFARADMRVLGEGDRQGGRGRE
jgi:hypothetical protein